MKVINVRALIREVAAAWRAQYKGAGDGGKQSIQRTLDALDGATATAVEVASIIGNESWTEVPRCDECGEARPVVVRLGQEPDYESRTAHICVPCLRAAIKSAKEQHP